MQWPWDVPAPSMPTRHWMQAMEVFWRHGYEGATIAQLTDAMGINPPSLYAAFGSKEGLLKAALDRYSAKRADWSWKKSLGAPTARDVAERLLMRTADAQTDPANPPGCLLVQGGLACGVGSENVPFELAARRAQTEHQLRDASCPHHIVCRARSGHSRSYFSPPTVFSLIVGENLAGRRQGSWDRRACRDSRDRSARWHARTGNRSRPPS